MNANEIVTVASYTDAVQANLAKGRLEVEGVESVLGDEHHVWANWVYSQALGGVKVKVRAEDAEAARAILSDLDSGAFSLAAEEEACAKCGGTEFETQDFFRKIALLAVFVISVPLPWRQRTKCKTCGYSQGSLH